MSKIFTHQRETVGVYARGGQCDDDIARLHRGVVQNLCLVHDADGKAGQVVLILGHHAGVLGGLAAHEGAARLTQPSATPLTISAIFSGMFLPQAM